MQRSGFTDLPFPVDTRTMDQSIELIQNAIQQTKIGSKEQLQAIKRLKRFAQPICE